MGATRRGELVVWLRTTRPLCTCRADVSPDGRVDEELAIACAVDHPNLTHVLGLIEVSPPLDAAAGEDDAGEGARLQAPPLLVMRFVPGHPMAAKPTSQHLLRCK